MVFLVSSAKATRVTSSGVYTSKNGKMNFGQVPHALKMDLWLKSKKVIPVTDWKTVSTLGLTAVTGFMAAQEMELFTLHECKDKNHLVDTIIKPFGGGYFWLV